MHLPRNMVTIASLLILTACSSLSSLNPFSKDDTKNVPAVLQDIRAEITLKPVWTSSIGKSGAYAFSPVQLGSDIFAGSSDGTLIRLESSSGRVVWRINTELPLTAGVGANANTIAVAAKKGVLLAYDLTGKLRWKIQASSEILTTPLVGNGLVIVRSIDNRIAAYDAESGERKWAVNLLHRRLLFQVEESQLSGGF